MQDGKGTAPEGASPTVPDLEPVEDRALGGPTDPAVAPAQTVDETRHELVVPVVALMPTLSLDEEAEALKPPPRAPGRPAARPRGPARGRTSGPPDDPAPRPVVRARVPRALPQGPPPMDVFDGASPGPARDVPREPPMRSVLKRFSAFPPALKAGFVLLAAMALFFAVLLIAGALTDQPAALPRRR